MKRWNGQILLIGLLAVAAPALAGPSNVAPDSATITLEALVAEALRNNPELEFYRAEIAAARGERKSAGAWPNPEVEVAGGHKRVSEGGLSREGTAWSVAVTQPFEFSGRLSLRKAIANRQLELAELGLEQFKAALAAKMRSLGYAQLAAQEKWRAAREVSNRAQELMEVLVQRDPAGVTPLLEARILEGHGLVLKRGATQAAQAARQARFELNLLRGRPLTEPLEIARAELPLPLLPETEFLLNVAGTNNFELRARRLELEQQGLRVDLSKNERWPALAVGPFYSEERAGEREQVAGIGVSLPVPLWNRNRGGIESARARQEQAATAMLLTQREIERRLREAGHAYELVLQEMSQWRTNALEELRDAASLGDRHYRLGALPVSTYVELQQQYVEAVDAILNAQQEALNHLQQIELLTGLGIEELRKADLKPASPPTNSNSKE